MADSKKLHNIKSLFDKWSLGIGNFDLNYRTDILEQNMLKTESILGLRSILHDLAVLSKQIAYAESISLV